MSSAADHPSRASTTAPTQPPVVPSKETPAHATARPRRRITPYTLALLVVLFWALPLAGFFFARYVNVLLVVFLAILLATFLTPVVNRLTQLHINRGVAILLIYLLILGAIYIIARLSVSLIINETQKLIDDVPTYLHHFAGPLKDVGVTLPSSGGPGFSIKGVIAGYLAGGGHSVGGVAGKAVGLVFTASTLAIAVLAIIVLAFFLTVQQTFTADLVTALVPPAQRARWIAIMSLMGERMGGWVIGQIIITIYYAVAFGIGLSVLGLPDAIGIAVITGALEIIPFVGGFIGAALAVLVALTVNPTLVIWVVLLYLLVTNVEAHILVPLIYGRAVHVHPFLVIVALLFGAEAFGILGAIIAVPIAAALQVAVQGIYVRDVIEPAEREQSRSNEKRALIDLAWLYRLRGRQQQSTN